MIMSPTTDAQLSRTAIRSHSLSDGTEITGSLYAAAYCNNSTSWTPVDTRTPIFTNPSRKRSRDRTDLTLDHDGSYFPWQKANAPASIPEQPSYGEGINSSTDVSIPAGSQTGTWYEKEVGAGSGPPPPMAIRPPMLSARKSVRLDPAAPTSQLEQIAATVAQTSPPKSSIPHPSIDDYTYALGIGWTSLASEDPDIQAAARGWARYLKNHYSRYISGAEILLKSKGLNAYLVGCPEGFYLFSEDLLEGKLVGRNWESCLNNLRAHPAAFEGQEVLRAERTPGPDSELEIKPAGAMSWSGT